MQEIRQHWVPERRSLWICMLQHMYPTTCHCVSSFCLDPGLLGGGGGGGGDF